VHLEHADAWEDELIAALPDGYWLDGGRPDDDSMWHFHLVQDGVERPIGAFFGETLDDAIGQAIADAQQRHAGSGE
jgi:hypothetical protein